MQWLKGWRRRRRGGRGLGWRGLLFLGGQEERGEEISQTHNSMPVTSNLLLVLSIVSGFLYFHLNLLHLPSLEEKRGCGRRDFFNTWESPPDITNSYLHLPVSHTSAAEAVSVQVEWDGWAVAGSLQTTPQRILNHIHPCIHVYTYLYTVQYTYICFNER